MRLALFILLLALPPVGCSAPRYSEGAFDSPDPAAKLYAIRRAGETRDRSLIPALVEQLSSDDPAVRVFTIHALENITGERLGYNPYADDFERYAMTECWIDAVKSKRFATAERKTP